ncbi:MAG: QueT transporter family protein [Lachnospiraceae bacterium]|nr:QueT transporter family protein [Lachnospiraceae bacterium]
MKISTATICQAALIAAVYTVLSLAFLPISFGPVQCRISEMLTVLPAFLPAAIPGVAIGCLITNILGGAILPDIIFGTLATLIGAVLTRLLTRGFLNSSQSGASLRFRLAAVLPPIISNTIIVPLVLKFAYMYDDALYFMAFTVCLGEIIGIGVIGNILITVLSRQNILSQLMKYSDCRA